MSRENLTATAAITTVVLMTCACASQKTATVDGKKYAGLDQVQANRIYDNGYQTCYVAEPKTERDADGYVTNPDHRPVAEAGCRAANLDIAACVPPIYYNNGGPFYCETKSGRLLQNPDGSPNAFAFCAWDETGWRCDK